MPSAADQSRHPWLGVEVRHLAALAAIASERSFSGAASDLGYVQSAVSQQIAKLERVVGMRLIERCRGHRPVGLTPAGELLVRQSRTLLETLHAARADLDGLGRVSHEPAHSPKAESNTLRSTHAESWSTLPGSKSSTAGVRIVREVA
jgi:molybdate transport repressor ModE-like protein